MHHTISEVDRLIIETVKLRQQLKTAEAKAAIAANETAELNYRYTMLQIYFKYGLSADDKISDTGDIIRNTDSSEEEHIQSENLKEHLKG